MVSHPLGGWAGIWTWRCPYPVFISSIVIYSHLLSIGPFAGHKNAGVDQTRTCPQEASGLSGILNIWIRVMGAREDMTNFLGDLGILSQFGLDRRGRQMATTHLTQLASQKLLTRGQRLYFLPPKRSHEPPEAPLAAFSFSFFLVNAFVNMSFSFLEILILVQEMSSHSNYVHQLFQSLQPALSQPEMERRGKGEL